MADPQPNIVEPQARAMSAIVGDVPERTRRRYLTEAAPGSLAFYVDATTPTAAFRDHGRRLSTERNDPQAVREIVEIARHRGWDAIRVSGTAGFRREVWRVGTAAGLEVRGYRPTERDRQDAARHPRREPQRQPLTPGAESRFRVVESVVRNKIVEGSEQDRILGLARQRLAAWLERGARFTEIAPARRREHRR
jgi:hypothetical protein